MDPWQRRCDGVAAQRCKKETKAKPVFLHVFPALRENEFEAVRETVERVLIR
jgi:hypothetical protein